jgi:hypothetical protein
VLQPFEWDKIRVIDVSPLQPADDAEGSLALIAPLFQERYLEGWGPNVTQRVDGHVYVANDGSNYVNDLPPQTAPPRQTSPPS